MVVLSHKFLGVGKNFRLLMRSCCFFSPEMKISQKLSGRFPKKICTDIIHPKVLCDDSQRLLTFPQNKIRNFLENTSQYICLNQAKAGV